MAVSKQRRLFTIYAQGDLAAAQKLKQQFAEVQIKLGIDLDRRVDSHAFSADKCTALRNSDAALVLWSQYAAESLWVEVEIRGAEDLHKPVILLHLEDFPLNVNMHPDLIVSPEPVEKVRKRIVHFLNRQKARHQTHSSTQDQSNNPFALRSSVVKRFNPLSLEHMAQKLGFFEKTLNPDGYGVRHQYESVEDGRLLHDYATGLMWQVAGSAHEINYEVAAGYVDDLNRERYSGFREWRLPTVEEALSLLEPTHYEHGLYLDPLFGALQKSIWTCDAFSGEHWTLNFSVAQCFLQGSGTEHFVRAVRTLETL